MASERLLAGTFLACAYATWSGITGREPVPIPDVLGGGPKQVTGTDPGFGNLDVDRDESSLFAGSISAKNSTDTFQDVLVTVDLFNGDQNVGELFGTVTVKPGTESSVELMSFDSHVPWSDAHVDLLRSSGLTQSAHDVGPAACIVGTYVSFPVGGPAFTRTDSVAVRADDIALRRFCDQCLDGPPVVDQLGDPMELFTSCVIPIESAGPLAPPAVSAPQR